MSLKYLGNLKLLKLLSKQFTDKINFNLAVTTNVSNLIFFL